MNIRKKRSKKGFSLIELIIVIAVMAVLVAILAPKLLQYTDRSRAQKDTSAMDEVVNAVQLALSDSNNYDEMLRYSCDNNYVTYTDSSGEYGQKLNDEEYWAPDGAGRATTITFNPTSSFWGSTYKLDEAIVNDMTYGNGSTAGETRTMVGSKLAKNQCLLKNASTSDSSTTAYLYNRIRQSIGESIKITSQTYKNSSFTIFIRWKTVDGTIIPDVYGSFNGTNLYQGADASLGSGTKDYDNAGEPITRPVVGGLTSSNYHQSDLSGSGGFVGIPDYKIDRKIKVVKLYGKTTQNGTPTPENPVPLVSGGDNGSIYIEACGRNLLNYENLKEFYGSKLDTSISDDGYITITNNTNYDLYPQQVIRNYQGKLITHIEVISNEKNAGIYVTNLIEDDYKSYINNIGKKTFTNNVNGYFRFMVALQPGASITFRATISSDNNTSYEPYMSQTITLSTPKALRGIPVSSGGNYTDATGQQWICDEVDFERGVYVQRVVQKTFDGTESWKGHSTLAGGSKPRFKLDITGIKPTATIYDMTYGMATHYEVGTPYDTVDLQNKDKVIAIGDVADQDMINILDLSYTNVTAFKAYLAQQHSDGTPLTIQYALETPIETPLSQAELDAFKQLAESGLTNISASNVFVETEIEQMKQ